MRSRCYDGSAHLGQGMDVEIAGRFECYKLRFGIGNADFSINFHRNHQIFNQNR